MAKKQSSLITHEGEINGRGNITYLKASKNEYCAPGPQDNVRPERNFSNVASIAQGFNPVVNDPQNLDSLTQQIQGFNATANMIVVSNDISTGVFRYSVRLDEQNITDASNLQLASSKSNQNATGIANEQWVPLGNPPGASWKYYKNGSPVYGWVVYNGGWYYLGADQYMVTGWMEPGGKWFYLKTNIIEGVEKDGKMALGCC